MQVTTAKEALLAFIELAHFPPFAEFTVKIADGGVSLIRYGRTLRLDELDRFAEEEPVLK